VLSINFTYTKMIDRIKKKVEFFINTEMRGNFTPGKFELALHDAIQGRNEEYFYDLNKLIVRENRGMISGGLSNIPDKFSSKILHYLVESPPLTITNDRIGLPNDWRYLDEGELVDGNAVEYCKNKREFNILKSQATTQYPIYTIIGDLLLFAPTSATPYQTTISYIRQIKYPKWTYTAVDGAELFNPDAVDFQDADIHISEENEIVRRVLMSFGVNLKEEDLQRFTMQEENTDFNQNNAT